MNERSTALSMSDAHEGVIVREDKIPRDEHAPARITLSNARTLAELHVVLRAMEARENPDAIVPLRDLRMTEDETMSIPGVGNFAMTDWAKAQLSARLGIRWDKWFAHLDADERASEVNKRLERSREPMRLRTVSPEEEVGGTRATSGLLRAFVAPSYVPIADSLLAGMLLEVLGAAASAIYRLTVTDKSIHYGIKIGETFNVGDRRVGDLRGGIMVRNSGVGFTRLVAVSHLVRLICTNGMVTPVSDPVLIACVHRGVSEDKIRSTLSTRARDVGGQLRSGAERLMLGRRVQVPDLKVAFLDILERAHLPQKHIPALEAAYAREPEATAFGVVQAATLAAQHLTPELRYDLERAAAGYLTAYAAADDGRRGMA